MLLCTPNTPSVAPTPTSTVASPNAPRVYNGPSENGDGVLSLGCKYVFALPLGWVAEDKTAGAVEEDTTTLWVALRGGGAEDARVTIIGLNATAFSTDALLARWVIPFTVRLTGGAVEERCFESPRARF